MVLIFFRAALMAIKHLQTRFVMAIKEKLQTCSYRALCSNCTLLHLHSFPNAQKTYSNCQHFRQSISDARGWIAVQTNSFIAIATKCPVRGLMYHKTCSYCLCGALSLHLVARPESWHKEQRVAQNGVMNHGTTIERRHKSIIKIDWVRFEFNGNDVRSMFFNHE